MGGYIGNEPTTGHFPVDNFTSSGGSTYTLSKAPGSAGAIEVSVQGVLQPTTAYTVSGTTLTMAGVTSGVKIFVRHLGETLVLPTPADGTVTATKLAVNSVDGTKIAMGSDARGDILYHGATDYTRLAKGTSGHVLTMGANDPAWAAPATPDSPGWKLLSSTAVSNAATVDQTGINRATYPTVAVIVSDLLPASDGQALYVRFGDSSGFDTGASDYTHAIQYGDATASNNTFTQANDTTNAFINTDTGGVGNAAGEGVSAILYVSTGHNGGRARMQGTSVCSNGSGNMIRNVSFVHRNYVIVLDRIRVYFNSGNIASWNVAFYGLSIS